MQIPVYDRIDMKKLTAAAATLGYFLSTTVASAAVQISIKPPTGGVPPGTELGVIIGNALTIVFVIAVIAVLFMLVIGAFQWITSGGDKEAVGKARGRITSALVGLAILALAFLIVKIAGGIVNIDLLNLKLPSLSE